MLRLILNRRLLAALLAGAVLLAALVAFNRLNPGDQVQASLVAEAPPADLSGFARVLAPRQLEFPADHGPHLEYQTEWWYYTGNLESTTGQHFGFQLTFFRRALLPPQDFPARVSDWATDQVYMAHFALTDVAGKRYQAYEKLERGAAGLAGAQADPYRVWLNAWSVEAVGPNQYRLQASQDGLEIDLEMNDLKGPVLQGDEGFSRKGPDPGQASYYYSLTRLETTGKVQIAGQTFTVTGLAWMDHEFSTSYLSANQSGWDWFAIQLDDGSELMLFQLRQKDGSRDPFSSGTWIAPNGETQTLSSQDFRLEVRADWKSPHSQAVYPSAWTITIPSLDLAVDVEPYLADQELNVSYAYWEGAVRIRGQHSGQPVSGSGYTELTGYARSMGGEF